VPTFCRSEGLRIPSEGGILERAERSTPALISPKATVLQRLRAMQAEGYDPKPAQRIARRC